MEHISCKYDSLSSRAGFNSSLRHFNLVMDIIDQFEEDRKNLADIINNLLFEKQMEQEQIKPVVSALLFDKYKYSFSAYNLKENITDFTAIQSELSSWNAVDIVLVYYHPELGITIINPKDLDSWIAIQALKRNELVSIYVGEFTETETKKLYDEAINKIIIALDGKKFKTPAELLKGKFKPAKKKEHKAPVKKAAKKVKKQATTAAYVSPKIQESVAVHPSGTKGRMTPMYGITVTNELFHNGNVEAWKKIINSYEYQHEGLEVLVFYDGEKINDINTLFKWGKVKRGTAIMISVVGENIKNVAKLKRYLMQGASNRFEAFLKGPPNQMLKLF